MNLKAARNRIRPCVPPFWAESGHAQTLLGHLLSSPSVDELGEGKRIDLGESEDLIHSTYLRGQSRTVVYLFHGLGGSSEASYMQRTALVARSLGHHVFLNNHRGCGEGVGLAVEPYHSGRAEDLSKVIAFGRESLPDHLHLAIGFSLSANALLLLSAGIRGNVLPDFSIAVNGPIELESASLKLTSGLNWIYNLRFVSELKSYVKQNTPNKYSLIRKVRNLRTFDDVFTAKMGGFENRDHYYKICSAKQYLSHLKIPTVLLTAKDDPFVDFNDYLEVKLPENCLLHIEEFGGHMGYLSREGHLRWLDYALKEYIKEFSSGEI